MSDLGLLSYQYQELAELARQLKQWAVQIKRAHYHLPAIESSVTQVDLPTSLEKMGQIARFLNEVITLEDEGAWPANRLADPPLPSFLVERVREEHTYEIPLYVSQLARFAAHLDEGIEALTDKDMELLDGIVLAADADANAVFRRLMRWT